LSLKKLAPYKEIFPALAKTDAIDARRILEPFRLRDDLAVARGVLQEIVGLTQEAERLKRFTRRRRQLVNEKVRVLNRM
jgi:transposase